MSDRLTGPEADPQGESIELLTWQALGRRNPAIIQVNTSAEVDE